ncbi:probable lysosomal cobalamin transporter [Mizuhopecten yessoensis]|uniref:probable lysosomal cobalamin transporter n=1 Tax=Mizuhopecten yessoensis TaxID=6573 RepID=UPI000B45C1E7|nr:probable lysosomal cobalamin transporter [Mizuhopecten yessoensis]
MAIPSSVLAAGWIPFVVIMVLVLLFSTIYIKYFMSKRDSTISSTISAIVALSVILLTTALIPVDVFLVSYMKNSKGQFKDWANDSTTRESIERSVAYGYYTLYGLVTFCLFVLLPFMYFFYEERDEDTSNKTSCCSALKYTVVFVIIVAVLLMIGAFVPTKNLPNPNATDYQKIKDLFSDLTTNDGEDALSFVISIISLLGMCALITYTAYGMSAMPMGLIKGRKGAKSEKLSVQSERSTAQARIQSLKDKYSSRSMSSRRRNDLSNLEESDRLMERKEKHLATNEGSILQRCLVVLRPFEVVFGVFFFLITLLIFVSLLLTNIDKAMHSLGYKFGYALPHRTLPNPVDMVLVFCQKVFPLDYIMFSLLVVYLVFCSMSGVRNIGIWFFWLKMYKIRPRRTRPQGILMLCMILMFIMSAINIIIYELTPQYSSFGSQRYTIKDNSTSDGKLEICSTDAHESNCVISRMALLLTRFFYKMWFFGAAYYWTTWVFLGFMLIGFLVAFIKKRKSAIDGEVDEDDFDDSDEEMLRP